MAAVRFRASGAIILVLAMLALAACKASSDSEPTKDDNGATAVADGADQAVRPLTCTTATPENPSVDEWVYQAAVSKDAGLVIQDARFGPRLMAKKMSIPYVRIMGVQDQPVVVSLSPEAEPDQPAKVRLIDGPTCNPGGHDGVSATYEISYDKYVFDVEQSYRFDPFNPQTRCEASTTAQCVQFWPTVTWGLVGSKAGDRSLKGIGLDVVERFQFAPDAVDTAAANLVKDSPNKSDPFSVGHKAHDGSLDSEGAIEALNQGKIIEWENWHQTDRSSVALPGIPHAAGGSGYAGCTECVHAHWSWFGSGNGVFLSLGNKTCGFAPCWTDGSPQTLPRSGQHACLGWTKATSPTAIVDWCTRAQQKWKGAALSPTDPSGLILYWQDRTYGETAPPEGVTIRGQKLALGDSYWPQLGDGLNHQSHRGDTGAMFFVPARWLRDTDKPTAIGDVALSAGNAKESTKPGNRLPAGWIVPVTLRFPAGGEKGPYYLRVHSDGPRLLNPSTLYSAADTGEPWVDVFADRGLDAEPNATTPRLMDMSQLGKERTAVAYAVFDREPSTYDVSFQLDAAPDGVQTYHASNGRWSDLLPNDDFVMPPLSKDAYPPAGGLQQLQPVHEVGFIVKVEQSTTSSRIWVDRVAWHWCTDKERASDTPQCPNDYRITNDNPHLRRYALTSDVTIRLLSPPPPSGQNSDVTHRASLDELEEYTKRGPVLVDLRHSDPQTVTGIAEPFRP